MHLLGFSSLLCIQTIVYRLRFMHNLGFVVYLLMHISFLSVHSFVPFSFLLSSNSISYYSGESLLIAILSFYMVIFIMVNSVTLSIAI